MTTTGASTRRLVLSLIIAGGVGCDDPAQPPPAGDASPDALAVDVTDATIDATTDAERDAPPDATAMNPIERENAMPGSDGWLITRAAENHEVEGYASVTSVAAGSSFTLHVNVSEARPVRWEAYRIGYYRGDGGRLVAQGESRRVEPQPACPIDRATGLIECRWSAAFTVATSASWVTGEYLFKLIRDDGFEQYVPMIVREPSPRAPLLFQASVNTWQAYNDWGAMSLYVNGRDEVFTGPHAYAVSFDRPYSAGDNGSGEMLSWEMRMARWLEQRGYDVAYVTNVDVDATPEVLRGRRMFLSVGHDEYWTTAERDAVEAARDAGLNIGFFTADTATFHVRYAPSSGGAERRTVVCYKVDGAASDPERGTPRQTTRFAEPALNRPENALLGVMYAQWTGGARFPMVVRDASHWIYEGTNVERGDTLPGIVGSEYDRLHDNGRTPRNIEVVAESPGLSTEGIVESSHATVYYPTPTSLVFAAGTLSWALALGRTDMIDARVQRMTENILARAGLPVATPTAPAPRGAPVSPGTAAEVTLLAGDGAAGYVDGPAATARFDAPAGLAAASDGALYVTDSRNHRVRVIRGATVSTLAGCGPSGVARSNLFRDGAGDGACFDLPTGIAVGPDGTVYVSDTGNNRIRAITAAGVVSTYAGAGSAGRNDAARERATFSLPRALAFGADGALYVADAGNDAIRRITGAGVTTVSRDLVGAMGLAIGADGTMYVTTAQATLLSVGASTTRLAGSRGEYAFADGPAADARVNPGDGVALLGRRVVFADSLNHRLRALSLDDHAVTTLVGDGRRGAGVGAGATTQLAVPRGVTAYREGLALADAANHRVLYVRP